MRKHEEIRKKKKLFYEVEKNEKNSNRKSKNEEGKQK